MLIMSGSFIVAEEVVLQPLLSIIFKLYVPGQRLSILSFVSPLLQKYIYGVVPSIVIDCICPSHAPKQLVLFEMSEVVSSEGSVTKVVFDDTHPLASTIESIYVPGDRFIVVKLF